MKFTEEELNKYLAQTLKASKIEDKKGRHELAKLILQVGSRVAEAWLAENGSFIQREYRQGYHNDLN
jgi:hypothetical protein